MHAWMIRQFIWGRLAARNRRVWRNGDLVYQIIYGKGPRSPREST